MKTRLGLRYSSVHRLLFGVILKQAKELLHFVCLFFPVVALRFLCNIKDPYFEYLFSFFVSSNIFMPFYSRVILKKSLCNFNLGGILLVRKIWIQFSDLVPQNIDFYLQLSLQLHKFFLSLLLLIRCILSLLKIFGCHRESNPGPLYSAQVLCH